MEKHKSHNPFDIISSLKQMHISNKSRIFLRQQTLWKVHVIQIENRNFATRQFSAFRTRPFHECTFRTCSAHIETQNFPLSFVFLAGKLHPDFPGGLPFIFFLSRTDKFLTSPSRTVEETRSIIHEKQFIRSTLFTENNSHYFHFPCENATCQFLIRRICI